MRQKTGKLGRGSFNMLLVSDFHILNFKDLKLTYDVNTYPCKQKFENKILQSHNDDKQIKTAKHAKNKLLTSILSSS